MTDPPPSSFADLFIELFAALPRQGPGDPVSTKRAFEACSGLPPEPRILDLGCGAGAQTLNLAQLTAGHIVAVDIEPRLLEQLRAQLSQEHDPPLRATIETRIGDMKRPQLPLSAFDLVWSEGALYNLGIERGLATCGYVLRPGGYLAFTEAVWRTPQPAAEVRAAFADYEGMDDVPGVIARIESTESWSVETHFPLPARAWVEEFYAPMEREIERLRTAWGSNAEALALLEQLAAEPDMHRRYGEQYGYQFFVLRHA